jgi:hypothetical protein
VEKEHISPPPKLIDVAARDYPRASEILISFPDQWEYVNTLTSKERVLYIGAFPWERSRPTRDHFHGLAPEINVSLVFYRLYKFFEPWPMPQVTVEWNSSQRHGRVTEVEGFQLQLQQMGQAQAWFGLTDAVLWECYFQETRRRGNWEETLAETWQSVEHDLKVNRIFTAPREPTFEEGYTDFLARLGYSLDLENPDWWSKRLVRAETTVPR